MRYVIYLLVAINGAYFTWQFFLNVSDAPTEHSLPALPFDVRRLVTIEEKNAQQSTSETRKIEGLTATQPPGAISPLSCQALGPFMAKSEMIIFEKHLDRLGLKASPQTRYQREQVGYTVLLSSAGYEEALQSKRRLEEENITASFIGVNNELSLGAFSDRSRAEKILARAQALGLEPRIEPGYARRGSYWLVIHGNKHRDVNLAGLTSKYPELRVDNMACP